MEAFGRHLVVEPYLATVVLGGGLITALGSAAERRALLPAVMEGHCCLAFAHDNHGAPTRAERRSDGYVLQGGKKLVLGGAMADTLLVSARLDGGGSGTVVLPKATPGLAVRQDHLPEG